MRQEEARGTGLLSNSPSQRARRSPSTSRQAREGLARPHPLSSSPRILSNRAVFSLQTCPYCPLSFIHPSPDQPEIASCRIKKRFRGRPASNVISDRIKDRAPISMGRGKTIEELEQICGNVL